MSQNDSVQISNINLDELDRQNAEEEAVLQAEINAIKKEYIEKFGRPAARDDTPAKEAV